MSVDRERGLQMAALARQEIAPLAQQVAAMIIENSRLMGGGDSKDEVSAVYASSSMAIRIIIREVCKVTPMLMNQLRRNHYANDTANRLLMAIIRGVQDAADPCDCPQCRKEWDNE